jgi:galactofuranose transport system ATP-binding protein
MPLLEMHNITKRFTGTLALNEARLRVERGEVHALIGENGAGKSTLIKILTGVYRRDSGSITFDGQPIEFGSPQQAQLGGISTIYQEVNLVPYRSVAENIFLGREPRRWGLINWKQLHAEADSLMQRIGVPLDVTRPLLEFPIAIQQMVAVARAISFKSKLVVMDEPTSSLDEREVATLFAVIRQLKAAGVAVIFVSHRLDELYAICDRVTIMRDGQTVDEQPMQAISKLGLVAKMLGRELQAARHESANSERSAPPQTGAPLLAAEALQRGQRLRAVNLTVQAGKVVGLGGLLGSGRSETARALFGADKLAGGQVRIDGKVVRFREPADAIRQKIGFCSEDRKAEGIVPHLSVRENLTLAALPALARNGIVDRQQQQALVDRFIARLGIKTANPEQKIRELSGGNQQKVLLARWLCLDPRLLILDEPTRGIDVGAKAEIQALIDELASNGMGVLLITSELDELLQSSDTVVVLRDGRSVRELAGNELHEQAIVNAMAHGAVETEAGNGAA